jgi:hypothetical protein
MVGMPDPDWRDPTAPTQPSDQHPEPVKGSPEEPRTVQEAQFAPDRLLTLRTRGSAAYKGIYALLLKEGALDWRTGEPANVTNYFDDAIDIHHIFPRAWCEQGRIDPKVYNSVVNKTPLSARTNRVIGGWAPSQYLNRLANSAGVDPSTIDKHISTHLVDPVTLRSDDFDAFFAKRQHLLLDQIAAVLGKPIQSKAVASPAIEDVADAEDDTDDL